MTTTADAELQARLAVKVEAAKAYLRERGIYILDQGCRFRPTPAGSPLLTTPRKEEKRK